MKKIDHVLLPDERPFIGAITANDIGNMIQRHGKAGLCIFEVRKCCKSNNPFILVEVPCGTVEKVHWHYGIDRADRGA